jgi:mono/diheme cytochrome c family protein
MTGCFMVPRKAEIQSPENSKSGHRRYGGPLGVRTEIIDNDGVRRLMRMALLGLAGLALLGGGCAQVPTTNDRGAAAEAVFARNCASCHRLDGRNTGPGPDLSTVGARHTALEIRTKILNPGAWRTPGNYPAGIMPVTFADVLKPEELDVLVEWLAAKKGARR